jgi:hypothetical protein
VLRRTIQRVRLTPFHGFCSQARENSSITEVEDLAEPTGPFRPLIKALLE